MLGPVTVSILTVGLIVIYLIYLFLLHLKIISIYRKQLEIKISGFKKPGLFLEKSDKLAQSIRAHWATAEELELEAIKETSKIIGKSIFLPGVICLSIVTFFNLCLFYGSSWLGTPATLSTMNFWESIIGLIVIMYLNYFLGLRKVVKYKNKHKHDCRINKTPDNQSNHRSEKDEVGQGPIQRLLDGYED